MTLRTRVFAFLVVAAAMACSEAPTRLLDASRGPAVNASVRFLNLEGGCWTIAVDDVHYLPLNLPTAFKRDSLQVQVQFRQRDDYGSVCMVGPVVEILSIRSR